MKQKRVALFLFQAKGTPQQLMPSKLCPDLEGIVRSFMVMIQKGLMDILLVGFW